MRSAGSSNSQQSDVATMHAATGGADRLEAVRLRVSTGGLAFASRLRPAGLRDVLVDVFVDDQRVQLHHYPAHGDVGLYERGSVRIHDASGMTGAHRNNARPASTKLRWDDLDLLYFVGYALWNYVAIPTMLWQLPHRELPRWHEQGHQWRRIEVAFPPAIITHSSVQTFYLDERERIMRHDYVAEVFGRWALAAHYGREHTAVGDHWIATRRRVRPRTPGGRALPGPTLVWIAFDDVRRQSCAIVP